MKIAIIGLGLMGGSMGRALRKKTDHVVYACDADPETMLRGALIGAYHAELDDDTAREADVAVLAVCPSAMDEVMNRFLPLLKPGAVVTDVAGVKRPVIELMRRWKLRRPDLEFVGGHPMAGREFSGLSHSTAGLYEKASVILVGGGASLEALAAVKSLYLSIGAEGVVAAGAEEHDRIVAYTSQLAHIVSGAYVQSPTSAEHYGFSAGSFRDLTRVARLNPDMWTELMSCNSDFLSAELDSLICRLTAFANAVKLKDKEALHELLAESNRIKLDVESDRARKLKSVITTV